MKVTLVYPRLNKASFGSGSIHPPLGILYLASYLREHDILCSVIDCTFMGKWDELEIKLERENPDVIGFSFSTPLADLAFEAISIARNKYPHSLIVAGGPHPTVDPWNTINKQEVDVVVVGEGEQTFFEVINAYATGGDFEGIEGILYEDHEQRVKGDARRKNFIEDLDSLPLPARDLIDEVRYIEETGMMTLITSRGCPGNCSFCQPTLRKIFGDKIRAVSPQRIIEEIHAIKDSYSNYDFLLSFEDDCFCFNKKRILELCEIMVKNDLHKIPWWCVTRIDNLDEETIKSLSQAGCIGLSLGVESGSQRILTEVMRKNVTVDQIKKVFSICHQNSLLTLAFIMVGTSTETKEDLDKTVELLKAIHPDVVAVSVTTPLIGTKLHDYSKKSGVISVSKHSDYGYYGNTRPLELEDLTRDDVIIYKKRMVTTCYRNIYKNIPKYAKLLWRKERHIYLKIFHRMAKTRFNWLRLRIHK
jgi:radical SAM superfamily enzyme YgiQ (UPF0313 family)